MAEHNIRPGRGSTDKSRDQFLDVFFSRNTGDTSAIPDSSPYSDEHLADYPLVVNIRFVKGYLTTKGYVVTAETAPVGGSQPSKIVALTCGPKGKRSHGEAGMLSCSLA
jgi:hypothetical protein